MEILSLKLSLSEADLNNLVARHLGSDQPVRDLQVRLRPEGVGISGAYRVAFFNVRFETLWALSVQGREVAAQLTDLRVAGAPAGLVRESLLEMIGANIAREEGARVEGESILVDPDLMLGRLGLTGGRANLTAVRCEEGRVVVEGGAPA
jgi:hypothetical protein